MALFRLHVEHRGNVELTDANRELFRELAAPGLMVASDSFASGVENEGGRRCRRPEILATDETRIEHG